MPPISTDYQHYLWLVKELRAAARRAEPVGRIFAALDATWELLAPAEKADRRARIR